MENWRKHGPRYKMWAGMSIGFVWVLMVAGALPGWGAGAVQSLAFLIPKTWVDAEMADLEVPLATPGASPVFAPADYYSNPT